VAGEIEGRSAVSKVSVARRALASAVSLGMSALLVQGFASGTGDLPVAVWIAAMALIAAPALAAVAIWLRHLSMQLLARAYWWVQLLFGCLLAVTNVHDRRIGALAIGSACALLSAGRLGLDQDRGGRFRPVAFRGTLMLALVLAMADAGSFSWLGTAQAFGGGKVRLILFAPPMIAAVIGLLRLRTWGLLVSVVCNVLVAVLAGAHLLDLPDDLCRLFIAMAIVQLLVPLPMWVTIIRRRPPPPDRWQHARVIASSAVIVALAIASAYATFGGTRYIAP
jgi:hypothetical protein